MTQPKVCKIQAQPVGQQAVGTGYMPHTNGAPWEWPAQNAYGCGKLWTATAKQKRSHAVLARRKGMPQGSALGAASAPAQRSLVRKPDWAA